MVENGVKNQKASVIRSKIAVRSLVLVHVPNHSDSMKYCEECHFVSNGNPIKIAKRWVNGMMVDKIIVNKNFYGILANDLGKNIVARVEIIKKELYDGRKFIMLDIHKMPKDALPTHRLKITDEVGGFSILGTTKYFCFDPLDLKA